MKRLFKHGYITGCKRTTTWLKPVLHFQRKLSCDEMLYGGGVRQDNFVKDALYFPDDERSKRILSVDSTKRPQIKYRNNFCYPNFLKAVKRHQAKSQSHSSIGEDISEGWYQWECETTKKPCSFLFPHPISSQHTYAHARTDITTHRHTSADAQTLARPSISSRAPTHICKHTSVYTYPNSHTSFRAYARKRTFLLPFTLKNCFNLIFYVSWFLGRHRVPHIFLFFLLFHATHAFGAFGAFGASPPPPTHKCSEAVCEGLTNSLT